MIVVLFVVIGYLSGSVLYARLLAHHLLDVDLSEVGDGNPGTTNIGRAGGKGIAFLVFVLDLLKAAIPTSIAYFVFGIRDWQIIPIAIAPPIGHAYPIFFGFKGGKAIAAIAGSWVGIATWQVITVGGILIGLWYLIIDGDAWVVIAMTLSLGAFLLIRNAPVSWVGFWLASSFFLAWTHRKGFRQRPTIKI